MDDNVALILMFAIAVSSILMIAALMKNAKSKIGDRDLLLEQILLEQKIRREKKK